MRPRRARARWLGEASPGECPLCDGGRLGSFEPAPLGTRGGVWAAAGPGGVVGGWGGGGPVGRRCWAAGLPLRCPRRWAGRPLGEGGAGGFPGLPRSWGPAGGHAVRVCRDARPFGGRVWAVPSALGPGSARGPEDVGSRRRRRPPVRCVGPRRHPARVEPDSGAGGATSRRWGGRPLAAGGLGAPAEGGRSCACAQSPPRPCGRLLPVQPGPDARGGGGWVFPIRRRHRRLAADPPLLLLLRRPLPRSPPRCCCCRCCDR